MPDHNINMSGGVTPSGALGINSSKHYAGAVGSSGSLTILVAHPLAMSGGVTPSGTLTKKISKLLAGSVASSGTLGLNPGKHFIGGVGSAGVLNIAITPAVATCGLSRFELRKRVYDRLDELYLNPVYYTPDMVNRALDVSQRLFALMTLCIERTVTFNLTTGTSFYQVSAQISDYLVPLRIMVNGIRLNPDTLERLNNLDNWRMQNGAPRRYAQPGWDLLAIQPPPSSDIAAQFTYAALPASLTSDGSIPEIAEENHEHLPDLAIMILRIPEGMGELELSQPGFSRAMEAMQKVAAYTRQRNLGNAYDVEPGLDLSLFDRSKLLLSTNARETLDPPVRGRR